MPEPEMPTPVSEISEIHETLLTPGQGTVPSPSAGGARTATIFSLFFGLITGRHGASLTVRENVAQQLNDWRENWGYSWAVVVLDTIWNVAFVVISVAILIWFAREEKNVQLRVWICGYSLQCVVHVVLVWLEYRRRNRTTRITIAETLASTWSSFMDDDNDDTATGIATLIRRWDTEVHCIWLSYGLSLLSAYDHGAPNLFRLTVAYLAIDMFCVAIGLLLSCLLGLAYCFWLRWIIALMFFIRREEAALDADINILPRYKFVASNDEVAEPARMVPVRTGSECVLLTEDVVDCCICLGLYEDGSNLHLLPCKHHFHSACILSWLMVKSNCPICKRSIMQDE